MIRKIYQGLLLGTLFIFALGPAPTTRILPGISDHTADAAEDVRRTSVPDALQEILDNHRVSLINDLSCNQVASDEWGRLGEAVMNEMHPDQKQHEAMDRMMGGQGAGGLSQAHILMGKNYLGCVSPSSRIMGMMGGTMADLNFGGLGQGHLGWLAGGLMAGIWVAVIAALIAVTRYYWKKTNQPPQES